MTRAEVLEMFKKVKVEAVTRIPGDEGRSALEFYTWFEFSSGELDLVLFDA